MASTGKGPGSLPEFVALTQPLWRRWMASFLWAGKRVGGEEAEVLVSESKRKGCFLQTAGLDTFAHFSTDVYV